MAEKHTGEVDCLKCNTVFLKEQKVYDHSNSNCGELIPLNTYNKCARDIVGKAQLKKHIPKCKGKKKTAACRNGPTCRFLRANRCNYVHSEPRPAQQQNLRPTQQHPSTPGVKKCKNGEACRLKAQGRCSFHHEGVGVQNKQQSQPRRPTPTDQWPTMPKDWQHNWQQQSGQQSFAPINQWSSVHKSWLQNQEQQTTPQAQQWCPHGPSCNNGRFCLLRHYSVKDFLNLTDHQVQQGFPMWNLQSNQW